MLKPPSEFYSLLSRYGVPFVVIGGHAVQFHGYLRATEDVDLLWVRTSECEGRLLAALEEAHASWISNERDPATGLERLVPISLPYIQSNHLMMLVTDYGFADLFDHVPGFPDVNVAELHAQSVASGDLRYVSLEWLKKMKRHAGRPKDRMDLEQLE